MSSKRVLLAFLIVGCFAVFSELYLFFSMRGIVVGKVAEGLRYQLSLLEEAFLNSIPAPAGASSQDVDLLIKEGNIKKIVESVDLKKYGDLILKQVSRGYKVVGPVRAKGEERSSLFFIVDYSPDGRFAWGRLYNPRELVFKLRRFAEYGHLPTWSIVMREDGVVIASPNIFPGTNALRVENPGRVKEIAEAALKKPSGIFKVRSRWDREVWIAKKTSKNLGLYFVVAEREAAFFNPILMRFAIRFSFVLLGLVLLIVLAFAQLGAEESMKFAMEIAEREKIIDPLTGLYNRRFLEANLESIFNAARRSSQPFSVIMMDLDNFKRINDTLGHEAGDRALTKIGSILKGCSRTTDRVCRYGGDEFVVLLPNTSKDGALVAGRRILEALKTYGFSASMGVASFPDDLPEKRDPWDLIRKADKLVYQAKSAGKGRIAYRVGGETKFVEV